MWAQSHPLCYLLTNIQYSLHEPVESLRRQLQEACSIHFISKERLPLKTSYNSLYINTDNYIRFQPWNTFVLRALRQCKGWRKITIIPEQKTAGISYKSSWAWGYGLQVSPSQKHRRNEDTLESWLQYLTTIIRLPYFPGWQVCLIPSTTSASPISSHFQNKVNSVQWTCRTLR